MRTLRTVIAVAGSILGSGAFAALCGSPPRPSLVPKAVGTSFEIAEANGRLLFVTRDLHTIAACDIRSGSELWSTKVETNLPDGAQLEAYPAELRNLSAASAGNTVAILEEANSEGSTYASQTLLVILDALTGRAISVRNYLGHAQPGLRVLKGHYVFATLFEDKHLHVVTANGQDLLDATPSTFKKSDFVRVCGTHNQQMALGQLVYQRGELYSLDRAPKGFPSLSKPVGPFIAGYYNVEDFMDEGDRSGLRGLVLLAQSSERNWLDLWKGKFLFRFNPTNPKDWWGPAIGYAHHDVIAPCHGYGHSSKLAWIDENGNVAKELTLPFDNNFAVLTEDRYSTFLARGGIYVYSASGRLIRRIDWGSNRIFVQPDGVVLSKVSHVGQSYWTFCPVN